MMINRNRNFEIQRNEYKARVLAWLSLPYEQRFTPEQVRKLINQKP